MEGKIQCLSDIDSKVLKPIVAALRADGEDFNRYVQSDSADSWFRYKTVFHHQQKPHLPPESTDLLLL